MVTPGRVVHPHRDKGTGKLPLTSCLLPRPKPKDTGSKRNANKLLLKESGSNHK
jgi:hypothetical protein